VPVAQVPPVGAASVGATAEQVPVVPLAVEPVGQEMHLPVVASNVLPGVPVQVAVVVR